MTDPNFKHKPSYKGDLLVTRSKVKSMNSVKKSNALINPFWQQIGDDINGEATEDQSGCSVSISADGTVVAIGASGNSSGSGHVRVYKWNGDEWCLLGDEIKGESIMDQSGCSVSISADGTVVANFNNGNETESGHVREFTNFSKLQLFL